jgi:hypothetical protein
VQVTHVSQLSAEPPGMQSVNYLDVPAANGDPNAGLGTQRRAQVFEVLEAVL